MNRNTKLSRLFATFNEHFDPHLFCQFLQVSFNSFIYEKNPRFKKNAAPNSTWRIKLYDNDEHQTMVKDVINQALLSLKARVKVEYEFSFQDCNQRDYSLPKKDRYG